MDRGVFELSGVEGNLNFHKTPKNQQKFHKNVASSDVPFIPTPCSAETPLNSDCLIVVFMVFLQCCGEVNKEIVPRSRRKDLLKQHSSIHKSNIITADELDGVHNTLLKWRP